MKPLCACACACVCVCVCLLRAGNMAGDTRPGDAQVFLHPVAVFLLQILSRILSHVISAAPPSVWRASIMYSRNVLQPTASLCPNCVSLEQSASACLHAVSSTPRVFFSCFILMGPVPLLRLQVDVSFDPIRQSGY
jgi:hypothetical protein